MAASSGPARFHDRMEFRLPGFRDFVRIFTTGGFGDPRAQAARALQVPRVARPALPRSPQRPTITWVGHSSTILQIDGLTFLTDPVWSDRIPGRIRRVTPPGVPWDALPPISGVLLSHNHYDHLDGSTLKRLPRTTPIFCGTHQGAWFRKRGFETIHELDWWDSVRLDGVELAFVPCQHWTRRGPFDTNKTLWGSWVLTPRSGRNRIYFAGDTGYCRWFKEIGRRYPGIALALLPIGAYEPAWFMRPMHLNPEEAVQAFLDLGAERFLPIHWGTFVLSREPLLEPPQRVQAEWKRRSLAPRRLLLPALGEPMRLGA